jgi:hypothetical protein
MDSGDIEGRLAVLDARSDAARWMALLTAVFMLTEAPERAARFELLVTLAAGLLSSQGNENAAGSLLSTLRTAKALFQDGKTEPETTIALMTGLHSEAGQERSAALQEWMSVATEEEISADIRALLEGLVRRQASPDRKDGDDEAG